MGLDSTDERFKVLGIERYALRYVSGEFYRDSSKDVRGSLSGSVEGELRAAFCGTFLRGCAWRKTLWAPCTTPPCLTVSAAQHWKVRGRESLTCLGSGGIFKFLMEVPFFYIFLTFLNFLVFFLHILPIFTFFLHFKLFGIKKYFTYFYIFY